MSRAADQVFEALADPGRRALLRLLGERPHRPSELADRLGATRPAVSRQLRVLRKAGLLREQFDEEDARGRVIELRPEPLHVARDWIDDLAAFWGAQLEAFRGHVEASSPTAPRDAAKAATARAAPSRARARGARGPKRVERGRS